MRNFTSMKLRVPHVSLIFFFALLSMNVCAEGTPTVSPNPANITALLSAPDLLSGPYFNAPEDNRVKFTINDHTAQNLYFGFDFRQYAVGTPPRLTDVFWRIRRSSDLVVVAGPTVWNATLGSAGSIDNHPRALAGPNIAGSVPTGYTPLIFDPIQNGEYFIEIYRSSDGGATARTGAADRANAALFDLTVANNFAPFTRFNGRVNSDKWGFVALSSTFGNVAQANGEPAMFAYTNDQTIVSIDFQPGFQPIAFNVAVNSYGIVPGPWVAGRRSRNDAFAPPLTNGYRVFINIPDAVLYPVAPIPSNPTFLSPSVTGCGPYSIRYSVAEFGDVRLLLDLNGIPGFQSASADRILEAFDVLAGDNTIVWDGLNGLGTAVPSGSNVNLALTFLKGRFNLPLFDAELNSNGLRIAIIAPIPIANAIMYWDDSALVNVGAVCDGTTPANNLTGAGLNNSFIGTVSPARAWSGDGNLSQLIPAPNVGVNNTDAIQCNDYGNVRTLNTWGWGFTSSATNLNITLGCSDLSITKGISTATPLVGSNVTFTLTAQNLGTATSSSTVVNDLLPAGYTYVSDNGAGTYINATGVWTIGTLNTGPGVSLQIVATVNATGPYTNTATISGSQIDPVAGNNTSFVTPTPQTDNDNDGIADSADLDDDNDGIFDTSEFDCAPGFVALGQTFSSTANPGAVNNVYSYGGANAVFNYSLLNTTNVAPIIAWGTGVDSAGPTAGITGNYINVQSQNTNFPGNDVSVYTLTFSQPVYNLAFKFGGLDNLDRADFSALNGTTNVPGNLTLNTLLPANATITGQSVVSTAGGANSPSNSVQLNFNSPVTSITIRTAKNDGSNGNVTLQLYELTFCLPIDTDNDGIPNHLDTDSDNDGCSDANEYYNSASADGNDNATFGVGTPVVNPTNGTVVAASYTGSYADVINNAVSTACQINAVDDTPVTIASGAAPVVALNVLPNDTLSGVAVTTTNTNVTPSLNGPLSIDAIGDVTLAGNTPSGTYTITYQLCEADAISGLNVVPTNCDTAVATVIVANTIDAIDDAPVTVTTGSGVTPAGNVTLNDEINGVLVTASNTDVTPATDGPLSVDADGNLSVAPNTPSGTYTITYELCETGAVPTNCDTATSTVVVANTIDAIDDAPVTIFTDSVPVVVSNVTLNDELNGVLVTAANTDVTPVTDGPLSIDADGVLTLAPNTPAGTYTITYELCEFGAVPTNCDTAVATVIVNAFTILANDDDMSGSPVNGYVGNPNVVNAYTNNDTLNGVPVILSEITGSVTTPAAPVTPGANVPVLDVATGVVSVPAQTPAGTYTIAYQICENLNPTNCDSAFVTVVVEPAVILANDDDMSGSPVNGYDGNPNVVNAYTNNDTLNGVPVILSEITGSVTTPAAPVTPGANVPVLNVATGVVSVPAQTPAGTYTIAYQICENLNPTNCDSAVVTVVVIAPPINANDDNFTSTPINGYDGGVVGNVFDNNTNGEDTLNGVPVLDVEVDITINSDGGLTGVTIDDDGTITIPAQTPAGTYVITYTICEVLNPSNCDQATITIVVASAPIDAVDNDYTSQPVNEATGASFTISNNDTLNNNPLITSEVVFGIVDIGGLVNATLSPNGIFTVPAGTPIGTYVITYSICAVLNPTNCDTAYITIVVKDSCDFDDSSDSCDVIVYNAITDNNDGANDYFVLEGIERFPNNTVEIYNRWGVLVYEAQGYDNSTRVFRGRSEGRVTINQDSNLPEGTYFYILKYTKQNGVVKEKAGYLYINRQ